LIIIVGPTCAGKTELALKIAQAWGWEIISADSMQVYRYMDIGTAKPGKEDRARVSHHLIDVVAPDEQFNAAMYADLARKIIETAGEQRVKTFLVVGGAGLYIKALLGGIFDGPPADEGVREYFREQLRRFGKSYLYGMLKENDAKAASAIDPRHTSRIIRALEVWELSGKSIVDQQQEHRFGDRPYDYIKIGLKTPRNMLWEKIEKRTEGMIGQGLVEEVKWLLKHGYHEGLKSMQSLGYRHVVQHLQGSLSIEEAVSMINRDIRQYAKRQMTWFGADKTINWFRPEETEEIESKIEDFLPVILT
jgi:tRNA dimethylallyltransferase